MARAITPIHQMGRAIEAGHLRRYHIPQGKKFPEPLGHWRATAPTAEVLAPIAAAYNTTVDPWAPGNPKSTSDDHFAVDLPAELRVILMGRDCVDEAYVLTDAKRVLRRCDGIKAMVPCQTGGLEQRPCLCANEPEPSCQPKSRLWVVIPEATTTAVWQVHTGSYRSVGHLSRGVEQCFTAAAGARVADAILTIGEATTSYFDPKSGGYVNGRQHYPIISPVPGQHTVTELRALAEQRAQQYAAIGYSSWGDTPALGTGTPVTVTRPTPPPTPPDPRDQVTAAMVERLLAAAKLLPAADQQELRDIIRGQNEATPVRQSWSFSPRHTWTIDEFLGCCSWVNACLPAGATPVGPDLPGWSDDEITDAEIVEDLAVAGQ